MVGEELTTTFDIFRFSQKENRLTAQLMLVLEANKNTLLKRFLEMCFMNQHIKNLDQIKIRLQVVEGESTPDAVLFQNDKEALFIECKLESRIDKSQLISHVKSGEGKIPVICISSGNTEPMEIGDANENLSQLGYNQTLIRWVGWKQIYAELLSLHPEMREKYEVAGLISSLENENLSGPRLRAFKQYELSDISHFVRLYPNIFDNAKQLIQSVIEYVKEKDPNVEIDYKTRPSYPISEEMTARFRHRETEYHAFVCFDFGQAHIWLAWGNLLVKQLKNLTDTQMETLLAGIKEKSFKLESYEEGELREVPNDPKIIRGLEEERWAYFSHYYYFDDERFYKAPFEIVKQFGDEILLMLDFFKTLGLYTQQRSEAKL